MFACTQQGPTQLVPSPHGPTFKHGLTFVVPNPCAFRSRRHAIRAIRAQLHEALVRPQPAIILVNPAMPENIGSVARAMKNFGLTDLRLVAPKDGWVQGASHPLADATASHASHLLLSARLYTHTEQALEDLTLVYASTARSRALNKPIVFSRDLYQDMGRTVQHHQQQQQQQHQDTCLQTGIMFGCERTGLTNMDVMLANKVVTVDANPEYPILNLAQAVTVTVYDLFQAHQRHKLLLEAGQSGLPLAYPEAIPTAAAHVADTKLQQHQASLGNGSATATYAFSRSTSAEHLNPQELATRGHAQAFLRSLFAALEANSFFESDAAKRQSVEMHVHNLLGRVEALSVQDINLLRGMLCKLTRKVNT